MAGGAPSGEIRAIQELMPKSHIVAVDRDATCLDAAIQAGVDDVVQCDVYDWGPPLHKLNKFGPNKAISSLGKFDVISLDLCGSVTDQSTELLKKYWQLLTFGGVMLFTFSYGRDVVEVFRSVAVGEKILEQAEASGVSDMVVRRVRFLCGASSKLWGGLSSVMVYRGQEMPMCSLLFANSSSDEPCSWVRVESGDFELAVVYPESANLYDCPQERIEGLRRRFAALKAAITRDGRRGEFQLVAK